MGKIVKSITQMPIKRSSIENLKSRVNLVDVAGRYTTLKKRGHSYVGLSPFTKEKSPSFYVEPGKNVFYCFSTNRGGDLISFVQEMEKLTFAEAIETLAERYNIPLEYEEGGKSAPKMDRSLKKELQEIHLYAAEYFHKAFMANHPEAEAVRKYWQEERKFTIEVAKEFSIGYAPVDSGKLAELLQKKNFSPEALRQCGLYFAPNKPRFRGRLMIPIRDPQGQVIAFTGRKLPQTPKDDPAFEAKYVNSPETPIFKKGAMLFNFDRARSTVAEQKFFLMVEGQLDAIRVATSGYPAVVAPQGTAVTPEQLKLIGRYEPRLRVLLDGDRAGQAAALRMLPMALEEELDIKFLKLPVGVDPDLYFVKKGNLKELEALSPVKFAVEALWPKKEEETAQSKTSAIQAIFELIAASPSAITHEAFLDELIRLVHVEPRLIRTEFEKFVKNLTNVKSAKNALPRNAEELADWDVENPDSNNFNKNLTTAEFELLWLLIHHPHLAPKVAEILEPAWLEDDENIHGKLLNSLLAEAHEGAWEVPAGIERIATNDQARAFLFGLLARPLPDKNDAYAMANNSLKKIFTKYLNRQLDGLKMQLQEAQEAKNDGKQEELLKKQQFHLNSLKKIPQLKHG